MALYTARQNAMGVTPEVTLEPPQSAETETVNG